MTRGLAHEVSLVTLEDGSIVMERVLILGFKKAWEDAALAALPERGEMRIAPLLDRLYFRRSWITRFLCGRPYRRTASSRKRRARYYRSK